MDIHFIWKPAREETTYETWVWTMIILKRMLKEQCGEWMYMARDKIQRLALVNTTENRQVP
jgi:hypothetical protein